ncbi:hypothetical protein Aperf_G00000030700 [Anoplocephala perfoliata]
MSGLLLILFAFLDLTQCEDSLYRHNRIYRLQVPEEYSNAFMEALQSGEVNAQYDILHLSPEGFIDVMVKPSNLEGFRKLIRDYNAQATIIDPDVERSIELFKLENLRAATQSRIRRSLDSLMTHTHYLSFKDMEEILKTINYQNQRASLEEIGRTAENRSIWLLKISLNENLPIIWIDAGIHAREWIAPAVAFYLIDRLLSEDGYHLLTRYQFYIAPNINPDGYEYSFNRNRFWRKNRGRTGQNWCLGVDLNRNFPYKWSLSGSSSNPCSDVFRGNSAADQLETQSVVDKLTTIADQTKLYLTLHSFGQLILIPYGYEKETRPAHYEELRRLSFDIIFKLWKNHNVMYMSGTAADILYAAAGASDDFACGALRIPYTYTVELPDLGSYNFLLPPNQIVPVGRQMWDALQIFVEQMR